MTEVLAREFGVHAPQRPTWFRLTTKSVDPFVDPGRLQTSPP